MIDQKYGKNSLFCRNGYSYANFTILFFMNLKLNIFFIAVLLLFYYFLIKYLNSSKSRLSNQKSGMVLEVALFPNSNIRSPHFKSLS